MIDALFGIFDGFGSLIGLFFCFLYQFVPNLGLCILLFISAVILILSPFSRGFQEGFNDSIRTEPLRAEIREKYRGDSKKISEEYGRVRREYRVKTIVKPLFLNLALPILLIISIDSLACHPISYVLRYPSNDID